MADPAAAAAAQQPGRAASPQRCYHEGFLEKKSVKDKMGQKLWTSLCGNCLFFFNNTRRSVYIEKLDLSDLVSVSDDCCRDRNLDAARFTLHMKNDDLKMIAPSLEARELWKGFILSVTKLALPRSLNLLPGQTHMMKEVIEKEKQRRSSCVSSDANLYVPVVSDMPACYYNVSRAEAEIRLERYPEQGNLLLRPCQDQTSFAITTREDVHGSVFKHYRVCRRPEGGFIIDLGTPIICKTLHDVVTCMLEKTEGLLKPFLMEEQYEDTIIFVKADAENGELNYHCATNSPLPSPPALPPKPGKMNHRCSSDSSQVTAGNINISGRGVCEDEVEGVCVGPPVLPRAPVRLPHQSSVPVINNITSVGKKALKPPRFPKTSPRGYSLSDLFENNLQTAVLSEELKMFFKKKQTISSDTQK